MSRFCSRGQESRRPPRVSLATREALTAWAFLLPNLAGFSLFSLLAVCVSLWLSFEQWDLLTPAQFVGWANYRQILVDQEFWRSMGNTLYFAAGLVPLTIVTALGAALALNRPLKGIALYRAAFYLPSVTATVGIAVVWSWLLNPESGLINFFLLKLGVANPPEWLYSTTWAKPALILMRVWQHTGYYMLMFLAGLQTIPEHLYEAADIDGASRWQKFWHITLPLLSPTTFLVTVMLVIHSFNIFESVYVMTQGGPGGSTETILYYIYASAFHRFKMGYASALAWVLFVATFALTLLQFRAQRRWVHYE